ncbi:MAG: sulfurtransferase TusA family protein [Desulfarculus sp.]|nr:sulfurtransferase TusA family protein [Pseudomonadota bacterium]MBV1715208.1 sulfurtransferase TusA family protein [Desulfarculus sp.]MBU4575602.1 sulfurtransferase TusA family protein [Pseudomonadota bacterium]MBU4598245.1 sulfurtransferase TusA family protein [Pseudomonadota bacterium]MBV1736706.1 sulfurtransferase TusA family protein [Desulfarculus sp.]
MPKAEDNFPVTARIDTRGLSAAWSILCAERAVEELEPGQVLEVSISDPQLAIDLPRILHQRGNALMATRDSGQGLRLYVRRGDGEPKVNSIPKS